MLFHSLDNSSCIYIIFNLVPECNAIEVYMFCKLRQVIIFIASEQLYSLTCYIATRPITVAVSFDFVLCLMILRHHF